MMKRVMLLTVALTIYTGVLQADMIPGAITDVNGTAFNQGDNADPGDGSLSRIFDGSGLTVGDPADASTWTHNAAWPDNWQGQGEFVDGATPGAWLVADLGAVRTNLEELYVWNVREVIDRGTQDVDLYYAVDPTVAPETGSPYDFSSGGWTPLGAQVLPEATAADTPADVVIDLTGIEGRYFGFDINSNYGSTFRVGVAELQFTTDFPEPLTLTIDRDTGNTALTNETTLDQTITAYAVVSVDGTLLPDQWTPITGDGWSVASSTVEDLSQETTGELTLAPGESVDLGDAWGKFYEENEIRLWATSTNDVVAQGTVIYTGNNDEPFALGDLNFDGVIDVVDFEEVLRPGYGSDTTDLSLAETYRLGDLDGNMVIDETDALILKELIVDAGGTVAGLALADVPEPSSLILLGLGGLLFVTQLRKPVQARLSLNCFLLAVAIGAIIVAPGVTHADMIPGSIVGVTGTAFQQGDNADPGDGSLSRIFNGAGLTVGDAASSDTWTHNAAWQDNWQGQGAFTDGETPGAWLVADLGTVFYELHDLYIWNVREILDRGTQDVDLYYAVDPTVAPETGSPYDFSSGGWTSLGSDGNATINQATGADTPADMIVDMDDVPSARYVGFDIKSNYGSTFRVGFAEIQITGDPSRLTLKVDRSTGDTTILNEGESPIDLDLYRITSDSGSLDPTGWTSLEEQGINDDGVPNNGIGWETLGTTEQTLSEIILMGNDGSDFSTLGPGGTISLGNAFGGGDQDLVFAHHVPGSGATLFVEGTIEYVGEVPDVLLGDVNLDKVVNGLDVDPFVDVLLGGSYQAEADMNKDKVVNGLDVDPFVEAVVGGGLQAVPEPSTLVLLGLALVGLIGYRRARC